MKFIAILAGMSLSMASLAAIGAEKDTRGGTCDDAKKQHEYYCEGKNDPNDIFTQANIACNNAKRNMAAACDGVVEPDNQYQFKEGAPKQ